MEGNLDAVVALADRLARRSESRLTGDGQNGQHEEEEDEEVEELRMASPFCQGLDSHFSPQDVEIVKEVDEKVKLISDSFMTKSPLEMLIQSS